MKKTWPRVVTREGERSKKKKNMPRRPEDEEISPKKREEKSQRE